MRSSLLVSNPPFLPSLVPRYSSRNSFFAESRRLFLHGIGRNIEVPQGVQFDGSIMSKEALEVNFDDEHLMVQVCVTRTLPPALTLELSLASIKEPLTNSRLILLSHLVASCDIKWLCLQEQIYQTNLGSDFPTPKEICDWSRESQKGMCRLDEHGHFSTLLRYESLFGC